MTDDKKCSHCRAYKPATAANFHASKRTRDQLCSTCKECAISASRKWYADHREFCKERERKRYRDNSVRSRALNKVWRIANKSRIAAYIANQRKDYNKFASEWRKKNPEKRNAFASNYKARKRGAPGSYTGEEIKQMFIDQLGLCASCEIQLIKYHVDHVIPLIMGGVNDKSNLQLLCPSCNSSKGGKHPSVWKGRTITEARDVCKS